MARLLIVLAVAGSFALWLWLERRARRAGRDRLTRARAEFLNAADPPAAAPVGHEAGRSLGVTGFRVPPHWREARGPDGGAVFADPASGARALRLSVVTLERPRPEDVAFDLGGLRPRTESVLSTLTDGRLLLKHVDEAAEDGVLRLLYTWRLADPQRARMAVFVLAAPSAAEPDVVTADELRRVEGAIRAATLASPRGTGPPSSGGA
jgi:hypothetical protein